MTYGEGLVHFLGARLDDAEQALEDVLWYTDAAGVRIRPRQDDPVEETKERVFAEQLADIRAKRAIVKDCSQVPIDGWHEDVHPTTQWVASRTLSNLASIYKDHPDYRTEWRLP